MYSIDIYDTLSPAPLEVSEKKMPPKQTTLGVYVYSYNTFQSIKLYIAYILFQKAIMLYISFIEPYKSYILYIYYNTI